jgi:hypothetical protein
MDGLYSCTFGVKMKQTPSNNNGSKRDKVYALSAMGLFAVGGITKMSLDSRDMNEILLMMGILGILTVLVLLVVGGKLHVQ